MFHVEHLLRMQARNLLRVKLPHARGVRNASPHRGNRGIQGSLEVSRSAHGRGAGGRWLHPRSWPFLRCGGNVQNRGRSRWGWLDGLGQAGKAEAVDLDVHGRSGGEQFPRGADHIKGLQGIAGRFVITLGSSHFGGLDPVGGESGAVGGQQLLGFREGCRHQAGVSIKGSCDGGFAVALSVQREGRQGVGGAEPLGQPVGFAGPLIAAVQWLSLVRHTLLARGEADSLNRSTPSPLLFLG